ncbi:MAG TPA: electron transfer flavoprotein subunit alpha/FixB family protein [Syntrophales bacterium]|nr:electron transfer flavoprotein subunit alpha/FixB family protein [Syntrophales bacterium]HOX93888.1 electron transfer flavoprotein subunit alpha/FixB family protein [Syntrophales bacterium]HPI56194.1 electron transfer flavoprotein subunit alpha/FixB family protein [Syntrophales bacterium]HPN24382.1 electron transfer flavoprotein subunit alpha/FixB family protein [Syntrophales bacterium]HQM29012.1 electron transfer flavoprotein subunit alpha/FixB family protein [Syntrophales bacterium]
MAGVWVFGENRELTLELLGIGKSLAAEMGTTLSAFLAGDREQAKDYISHGADEILFLPPLQEGQSLDAFIPVIAGEASKADPDILLFAASMRGKDLAARVAAKLDSGLCGGCVAIRFERASKTFEAERLAYGGAAVQKVTFTTKPAIAAIPPKTFQPAKEESGREGRVRELPAAPPSTARVVEKKAKERKATNLPDARVVVCAGRGFDKKEDLSLVTELARALGGEVGCTRPISEELHWLPEELCIGLSGISVKPELYIGLGVSGQIQHMTGIRGAKVVAAVNKDENAPIFGASDLGIVGNLYDVVPKILEELKKTP